MPQSCLMLVSQLCRCVSELDLRGDKVFVFDLSIFLIHKCSFVRDKERKICQCSVKAKVSYETKAFHNKCFQLICVIISR